MKGSGLRNPFRRGPSGSPPPPGLRPKEVVRIYLMGATLVLALAAMIALIAFSGPDGEEGASKSKPPEGVKIREPGPKTPVPKPEVRPSDDLQEAIEGFRVEDPRTKLVKESPAFIALLTHFLRELTPEQAASKVDGALTPEELFQDPDSHRGKFVRMQGRLIKIYTERIQATTPTKTDVVYRCFMAAAPPPYPRRTIEFYLPELPKDPKTGKRVRFQEGRFYSDSIEIEGMFLRLHQYETQNPKTPFDTSGIIFAKNLKVFPKPEAADHSLGFILLVVLAALALISVVVVGGFMSRKYGRGSIHLRLHEERRRRKRKTPTPNGNG